MQVLIHIELTISGWCALARRGGFAGCAAQMARKKREGFCHIPVYSLAPVVSIRTHNVEA